jgi:hypothetical protein
MYIIKCTFNISSFSYGGKEGQEGGRRREEGRRGRGGERVVCREEGVLRTEDGELGCTEED